MSRLPNDGMAQRSWIFITTCTAAPHRVALGVYRMMQGRAFSRCLRFTRGHRARDSLLEQGNTSCGTRWVDVPNAGSSNAKVRVTALLDGAGGTFAPIPAGSYLRGDLTGIPDITDAPGQTVSLSSNHIAVNETTKAQWDVVQGLGGHSWVHGSGGGSGESERSVQCRR